MGQVGVAQAATLIFSDGLESGTGAKWNEITACTVSTVRPHSGTYSLDCHPMASGLVYTGLNHSGRVAYLSFWYWFQPGFTIGGAGHGHWWRLRDTDWSRGQIDTEIWPDSARPIVFYDTNGPPEWWVFSSPLTLFDGRWHHLEYVIDQGTPNVSDGSIKMWWDGALVINEQNRLMRSSSRTIFGDFLALSNLADNGDQLYIDDIEVWDGCPSTTQFAGTPTCAGGTADTTAPSTPTNLTATAVSSSQINLSWTASTDTGGSGLAGYHLERCQGSTCTTFTQIATPTGTTYSDTGLTANTPYRYRVRARDGANLFSGYSSIVSGTTQAPPVSGWPNEPAGSTLLTDFPFTTQTGSGWFNAYPSEASNCPIVSDITASLSPPNIIDFIYPTGFVGGNAPCTIYYPIPNNYRQIYFGYWWKPSNPWQGHLSGINKLSFLWWGNGSSYTGYVIPEMYGWGSGPFRLEMVILGADNSHIPECAFENPSGNPCHFAPNVTLTNIALGQWHRIEVLVQQSTTQTSQNGVLRWWLDGVKQGEHTNINTVNDPAMQFEFSPTWGGIGDTKTQTDHFWFDHVRISDVSTAGVSDTIPPSTPTMNPPTVVSSSQINLSWSASTDTGGSGLAGYHLERCQGATCTTFTEIASLAAPATSYPNTGLTANTTYRYRVRARDHANLFSPYSNLMSAVTRGDLTGDGKVDLEDLRTMIYMLIGTVPTDLTKADLDGDGQLLLVDLQALVRILVGLP